MTTRYLCQSDDVSEEAIPYHASTAGKAAELYVGENLEFDPTDPQDVIQVRVEFPSREFHDSTELCYIDVTIVLDWKPVAQSQD